MLGLFLCINASRSVKLPLKPLTLVYQTVRGGGDLDLSDLLLFLLFDIVACSKIKGLDV